MGRGGVPHGLWYQVLFGGTMCPLVPGPFWRYPSPVTGPLQSPVPGPTSEYPSQNRGYPISRHPSKDRGRSPPPNNSMSAATPRAVSLLRSRRSIVPCVAEQTFTEKLNHSIFIVYCFMVKIIEESSFS